MIKRVVRRIIRCLIGKKGIYGNVKKRNHFSKGVLVYENAKIGHDNYFSPYTLVNNAVIGNYCSIGPDCKIGLGEHDTKAVSTYPKISNGYGKMKLFVKDNPAVIENDVWLGAGVVVRQGVKISNGAVVGANSVVTHDIPPYAIAVGSPARIIKYRFDSNVIDELQESDWYNKEFEDAKKTVLNLCEKLGRTGENE